MDEWWNKWTLLIASSKDFVDYRHQADVCHAYHVLKDGGLRDENIIVMMYADIASNEKGLYIIDQMAQIFMMVFPRGSGGHELRGSGKVLSTGPDDNIFIYIYGNSAYRRIVMPTTDLRVEDFVQELIAKHESNSYKKMVIYIDANEAGSMFEGHLPNDINVYATTSSVANESSLGFYCPDSPIPPPPKYEVCLGDLYNISWMEDRYVQ
ncbi:hypothetical protein RYX36_000440 [Vicia faba]